MSNSLEPIKTISTTPLQQEAPLVNPILGEWNCYERDFPAYFATWPEPQDGHPDDYKEHHKLLTRVIGNVVNVSPNSNFFFMPCLHAIVDLFPCPEGMELRVPISVFDKRHIGQDAAKTWEFILLRAIATFFLWKFFVKMPVPGHSGVTEPPQLLVGDDDVDTMAKVWAPFFECAHISENPSFNTKDRLEVVYPHLHGKLTRFPIEFFPLATNSPCFSVGNLPQTVRHFGFSDTAANKIALTLDMVPTKVFTSTAASGVRKLWVRALPEPHNEHAYADRKRALQETNGSQGAWPETSCQDAVGSVLFVECQSRTVKHCGYSIRSVREWHNDYEMRRGIQQIKNKRFTKSTKTCQPCRGSSAPRTVLVDNRYYQRGANARRAAQRGANARRAAQRGANARRAAQRGATARRAAQRGATARRAAQRGGNARRAAQQLKAALICDAAQHAICGVPPTNIKH
eukprot:jgi/Tetstr1/459828/TSEL_005177.t1